MDRSAESTPGGDPPSTVASTQPAAPSRRSVLVPVGGGLVVGVLAALGWFLFYTSTGQSFRLFSFVLGLLVGLTVRRLSTGDQASNALAVGAGAIALGSIVLFWFLVFAHQVAQVNDLGFWEAWTSIGDTEGGWGAALPFEDINGWGYMGLAAVEAFFVCRLPRGAGHLALEPYNASPMNPAPSTQLPAPLPPRPAGPSVSEPTDAGSSEHDTVAPPGQVASPRPARTGHPSGERVFLLSDSEKVSLATTPPTSPDPAWHPDPLLASTERFWNGTQWTGRTRGQA